LLLTAGTVLMAPLFRAQQPPLQSHALALLITLTLVLSGYLFTAMIHPEKF
jgi:cytochrome c oxidase assembly factor CtaG